MIVGLYSHGYEAGKDTAAGFMREWGERRGVEILVTHFADEMKIVCADALGIPGDREYKIAEINRLKNSRGSGVVSYQRAIDPGDPSSGVCYSPGTTGRDFIIGLAGDETLTNGIRRLDPLFWINHTLPAGFDPECQHAIVADLRFVEEARWVREQDGVIVEVDNPRARQASAGSRSEAGLPTHYIDCVLENARDLPHLRENCDHLAETLFMKIPRRRNAGIL